MSNKEKFTWPKEVWTITNAGDTYCYLFKRVEDGFAYYYSINSIGIHIFAPEGLNSKFFLSELEALDWLEKQVIEYLLMLRKKKHDAQNRITRP